MELPQKQWALLEAALADYDEIIKDPQYEINMGFWHSRDPNRNVCYVCLAGCFLAGSLKWEYDKPLYSGTCLLWPAMRCIISMSYAKAIT